MTNAEKFKEIFGIEPDCGRCNPYPCEENDCKYWAECENQPGCPCDNWWDWEFEESTTENDLEVDCIDRQATLDSIIKRLGIKNESYLLPAEKTIYQQIKDMSSVTPQEPKKGHWIHDGANVRCSNCGIGYKDAFGRTSAITYNFCPNCGADMRAESEDKS